MSWALIPPPPVVPLVLAFPEPPAPPPLVNPAVLLERPPLPLVPPLEAPPVEAPLPPVVVTVVPPPMGAPVVAAPEFVAVAFAPSDMPVAPERLPVLELTPMKPVI